MKVLVIDNFDSFTYNLYQYVGELLQKGMESRLRENDNTVEVYRNNEITVEEVRKKNYDRIILSPGPGNPSDKAYFGVCSEIITELGKKTPVLGVCLGMQGIGYCFGGKVIRSNVPMHGKKSAITHDQKGVFYGIAQHIEVMRYHSLVVEKETLPDCLEVTAIVSEPHPDPLPESSSGQALEGEGTMGEIMGLRHKQFPIEGIQFHPESFATEGGKQMVRNFLFQQI